MDFMSDELYNGHRIKLLTLVDNFTRESLAIEVADHNINVNTICPGTVESPSLEGLAFQVDLNGDSYEHFSQGHLFRDRKITPQDIARATRWLVSEESRCLTGSIVNVDAGWSASG